MSAAFPVPATADDGVRRSDVQPWDESTRPSYAAPDAGRDYAAHELAAAAHLVTIHDHLRSELAQVRDLLDQVESGALDPVQARSHLNVMTMRQNNWTLGAYCQSYCRVVTTHHTIEDQSVFGHLRGQDPELVPVLDRLSAEHRVIAAVLDDVDRALVALVGDPGRTDSLRAAVDLLTDTMTSHLSYEERMLLEPLARFGFY